MHYASVASTSHLAAEPLLQQPVYLYVAEVQVVMEEEQHMAEEQVEVVMVMVVGMEKQEVEEQPKCDAKKKN